MCYIIDAFLCKKWIQVLFSRVFSRWLAACRYLTTQWNNERPSEKTDIKVKFHWHWLTCCEPAKCHVSVPQGVKRKTRVQLLTCSTLNTEAIMRGMIEMLIPSRFKSNTEPNMPGGNVKHCCNIQFAPSLATDRKVPPARTFVFQWNNLGRVSTVLRNLCCTSVLSFYDNLCFMYYYGSTLISQINAQIFFSLLEYFLCLKSILEYVLKTFEVVILLLVKYFLGNTCTYTCLLSFCISATSVWF